jgi:hypothetical protein
MKIACIGWGSLVWSPGVLRCKGEWQSDGPCLPLEFARTSKDGRLTLVLTDGASPVPALWVELDYADPESARQALAGREGSGPLSIGLWPGPAPRHKVGADEIAQWAQEKGLDAVVWTALPPKFDGVDRRAPASAAQAVAYLQGLDSDRQAKAREYVEQAPPQIRTEFRSAFEEHLGWLPGAP